MTENEYKDKIKRFVDAELKHTPIYECPHCGEFFRDKCHNCGFDNIGNLPLRYYRDKKLHSSEIILCDVNAKILNIPNIIKKLPFDSILEYLTYNNIEHQFYKRLYTIRYDAEFDTDYEPYELIPGVEKFTMDILKDEINTALNGIKSNKHSIKYETMKSAGWHVYRTDNRYNIKFIVKSRDAK